MIMKMHKHIATLSICMTIITSGLAGCAQSNESIENTSAVETTTAAEITTAVKTEMPTATTKPIMTTTKMTVIEDEFIDDGEEEIIFTNDGSFADFSDDVDGNEEAAVVTAMEDVKKYRDISDITIVECEIKYDDVGFFNEGLCPYKDSRTGLWGYMDQNFNVAIKPQFFEAYCFSEGLAAVFDGKKWGFINSKGQYAISSAYEGVSLKYSSSYGGYRSIYFDNYMIGFNDGYAIVDNNKTNILIDTNGNKVHTSKEIYDSRYYSCRRGGNIITTEPNEGYICGADLRKTTPINVPGSYIEIPMYDMIYKVDCLSKEHAMVKSTAATGAVYVIDKQGNCVMNTEKVPDFYHCIITENSYIITKDISNVYQSAVYDYSGNTIIPYYYTEILPVTSNGKAVYYIGYFKNGECELLDLNGNVLNKDWFDTSEATNIRICDTYNSEFENCAFVYCNGTSGYKLVNLDTDEVIAELDRRGTTMHPKTVKGITPLTCVYNDWFVVEDDSNDIYIYDLNGKTDSYKDDIAMGSDVAYINIEYGIIGLEDDYDTKYIKII